MRLVQASASKRTSKLNTYPSVPFGPENGSSKVSKVKIVVHHFVQCAHIQSESSICKSNRTSFSHGFLSIRLCKQHPKSVDLWFCPNAKLQASHSSPFTHVCSKQPHANRDFWAKRTALRKGYVPTYLSCISLTSLLRDSQQPCPGARWSNPASNAAPIGRQLGVFFWHPVWDDFKVGVP